MSSELTIAGTLTFPTVTGGPDTSAVLGAPTVTPSSTSGPQLTYEEGGSNSYTIPVGAPVTIPFGTLAAADAVYVGSDQAVDIVLDGGDAISLKADGFILLSLASIAAMTVEATGVEANVVVILLGD